MKEIGTFEAKTHLSALLDEVARGVEVVITRRGVAVARLVPAGSPRRTSAGDPIARAKAFAKGDYVVLIWEREAKDPTDPSKMYKYNDFDLFRIENGRIAEHWDGAVKNAPGAGRGKE